LLCYGNIARMRNVSECLYSLLVLALCLVCAFVHFSRFHTIPYAQIINNIWSNNFDEKLHRRVDSSLGKFNVTLDSFCDRPIGMLVDNIWEIPTSGPLETVLGSVWKKSQHHPTQKCFLMVGSGPQLIHSFLGKPKYTQRTESHAVQLFLQGSWSLQTE